MSHAYEYRMKLRARLQAMGEDELGVIYSEVYLETKRRERARMSPTQRERSRIEAEHRGEPEHRWRIRGRSLAEAAIEAEYGMAARDSDNR